MRYFSYNDFMDYKGNVEENEFKRVEEKVAKYEVGNGVIRSKNEIIEILSEKREVHTFLGEFLNLYEIGRIKCCTDVNLNKENNIVYKSENKQLYIFIKVIEEIDNNISYKMFEESLEIIKIWDEKKKTENIRYPIVIPIVIYTGNKRWRINDGKENDKINYITYKENSINFSYNIIKVNELNVNMIKNKEAKIARKLINVKINIYK